MAVFPKDLKDLEVVHHNVHKPKRSEHLVYLFYNDQKQQDGHFDSKIFVSATPIEFNNFSTKFAAVLTQTTFSEEVEIESMSYRKH